MFKDYLDMLRGEFSGYNSKKFLKDLMAGLTVAAVALPLALAFGVASGVDAAAGLVTAIISGIVITALSGAYYQISGPTGAMAAVLISVVAQCGLQGVYIVTFIAGVFRLLAGIFRIGKLTAFIPAPVITGFTSGIAIIIASGQINNFFGVTSQGDNLIEQISSYVKLGFSPDITTLVIGILVILFMVFFPKKWSAVVPSSLVAIILATLGASIFNLDVATVGQIPKTLLLENRLQLSQINFKMIQTLIPPAISIALLGMIESLLCGMSASRMTGVRLLGNQELIAQGIGNMILPFFGGIPATAAISRSSVAIKSGAQTRVTGLMQAAGLIASMFILSGAISVIPLSALAGVLMVTAWRMNEWKSIRYVFSHKLWGSATKFLVTMLATVVFDLSIAILLGVVLGLIIFVAGSTSIEISIEDVDLGRMNLESCHKEDNWAVVYITGPMFFMTSDTIKSNLQKLDGCEAIFFSMRGVPSVDTTIISELQHFCSTASNNNCRVMFCGVQNNVMKVFKKTGFDNFIGNDNFYFTVDRAIHDLLGE